MMGEERQARISGYLDEEWSAAERAAFERELDRDPALARELESLRSIKEVTDSMRLSDFPDQIWERYWEGTYNRLERRVGWLLFSAGMALLLAGGLFELVMTLLRDSSDPWWVRLATGALCGGVSILFVSVLRERVFMHRRDPYREVKR
jgi:anti-sigma factor RsiW